MPKDFLEDIASQLDDRISKNKMAVTGAVRYRGAREEWSEKIAEEQRGIPIEELLSDPYHWGKINIWPAIRDELIEIWHLRCDFHVNFRKNRKTIFEDTIYAITYEQAEKRAREKWPRWASEAEGLHIYRDRDLHTIIIEVPKGAGKDFEAAIIVGLLTREVLILDREELREAYNIDVDTTISINLMNRSEEQAKDVTFTEVLKRVNTDFFLDFFPPQTTMDQIQQSGRMPQDLKFPRQVVIFPGTGAASTQIGYTLWALVVDECNFMQLSETSKKSILGGSEGGGYDAADQTYKDGIVRLRSRFAALRNGQFAPAGLIVGISSTRLTTDFTQRMREQALRDPGIYYVSDTFWGRKELKNLSGRSFIFDLSTRRIIDVEKALEEYKGIKGVPQDELIAQ